MSISKIGFIAITLVAGLAANAAASPRDFDGTYYLACEAASYTLHFDLAGKVDGQSVAYNPDDLDVSVPCEADDPAIDAILDQVREQCLAGGLGSFCDDVETAVADANTATIRLVPLQITTQVTNADNYWAKLLKIFRMDVAHLFESGEVRNAEYLISDQSNGSNGDFVSLSLSIDDVAIGGVAGCATTTLGWIDGNIDRNADFALAADFDVDRSLTCGLVYGDDWLLGNIGLTFHGTVSGERAQP